MRWVVLGAWCEVRATLEEERCSHEKAKKKCVCVCVDDDQEETSSSHTSSKQASTVFLWRDGGRKGGREGGELYYLTYT